MAPDPGHAIALIAEPVLLQPPFAQSRLVAGLLQLTQSDFEDLRPTR